MEGPITRRALVGGALLAVIALPLTAAPASAAAAFTSVTIEGEGLSKPLNIRADADPELFTALLSQVTWMASRPGQTSRPAARKMGPKYTIVVFAKDEAKQAYELYPLADGGPRAFRPARQPGRRTVAAGWFFGRLNMSEMLRLAGVPLPARPDALSGGVGGGIGSDTESEADAAAFAPSEEITAMLSEWRKLFLLNGLVVLLIAGGLAGFARLIRSKT